MKKRFAPFFLLFLLCLGGCAVQSASLCGCKTPEDRIQAVVSALYTLPDEYHLNEENQEALWGQDGSETNTEALKAWEAYDRGRFHEEDFAPGVLEELAVLSDTFASGIILDIARVDGSQYSRYHIDEHFPMGLEYMIPDGASLSCAAVDCEQQGDGSWRFTAPVTLTDGEGGKSAYTIQSTAWFDEDGRFTDVQVDTDDSGLSEALDRLLNPLPENVIHHHGSGPTPGPSVSPAP